MIIKTKSFRLAIRVSGSNEAKKLALLLPGRLDTKEYCNFTSHLKHLSNLGYFAVSFDPPGTWESGNDTDLFTTTNYIQAVNELIEYFGNKPTLLLGHSRGGSVAILACAQHPSVDAIVAIMATYGPPSSASAEDIRQGFRKESRDLPPGDVKTIKQRVFTLSLNYFEDGKKYAVVDALQNCTKPKLLIYGTDDEFTTPENVKYVFNKLLEPKMLFELKCSHDYRYYPEAIEQVNAVITEFLNDTKNHKKGKMNDG